MRYTVKIEAEAPQAREVEECAGELHTELLDLDESEVRVAVSDSSIMALIELDADHADDAQEQGLHLWRAAWSEAFDAAEPGRLAVVAEPGELPPAEEE